MSDESLSASDAIASAVTRLSPSTADIEYMTLLALRECNDLDLLPPNYRAKAADRTNLEKEVEALAPTRQRSKRDF